MSKPFVATSVARERPRIIQSSAEAKYWKLEWVRLNPIDLQSREPVTSISTAKRAGDTLIAVTSGNQVSLISSGTLAEPLRKRKRKKKNADDFDEYELHQHDDSAFRAVSRFKDKPLGATLRADGEILCCGGVDPMVKVFETKKRNLLRQFKGHTAPVHVTLFADNGDVCISAGDDKTVKFWDLGTSKQTLSISKAHSDYIRCGHYFANYFASGSYDHTVKIWDNRERKNVFSFRHSGPIEAVETLSNKGPLYAGGVDGVSIFDIVAGKKVTELKSSQTVSALSVDAGKVRLSVGYLDGYVKIFDTLQYSHMFTKKHKSKVFSLDCSDESYLVTGLGDGQVVVEKKRLSERSMARSELKKDTYLTGAYKYFVDGKDQTGKSMMAHDSNDAYDPSRPPRRMMLSSHDVYYKKYEFTNALNAACKAATDANNPSILSNMIERMQMEHRIDKAITGCSENDLVLLLKLMKKHFHDSVSHSKFIYLLDKLIDLYRPVLANKKKLFAALKGFETMFKQELEVEEDFLRLQGSLDHVLAQQALNQIS